jgi:hypothetical protein
MLLKLHYQQLFIIFPDAETPLFSTFHSSHSQNTPVRHFLTIFIAETTSSSTCFTFLPSIAETLATFHFFPLLKHHCQQPFIIFPMLKHHVQHF